jgi:hypothetical protein
VELESQKFDIPVYNRVSFILTFETLNGNNLLFFKPRKIKKKKFTDSERQEKLLSNTETYRAIKVCVLY